MTRILLENCTLLDPDAPAPAPGCLLIEAGRIVDRLPEGEAVDAQRVDLGGLHLAPGFVDVHYHGRFVLSAPEQYGELVRGTGAELAAQGTTAYLPTTVAWPAPELLERVRSLARVIDDDAGGARALGLHLEGPWIRPEAAGAQPPAGIRPFDSSEAAGLLDGAAGLVRMVTFAPEVPGAHQLEEQLARRGILASLGHSLADDACVMAAVDRGVARHVTHLFNAMGGLHHRDRGLAGVALTEDRLSCDLICDGVHVHPAIVRLAARAKGDRLALITDRIDPEGSDPGFGSGALVDDGEALRLADGTLAGSTLSMARAVRNAVAFGALSLHQAVAAATLRPAELIGCEAEVGSLRPGARADLVVLGDSGRVEATWLGGAPLAG